LDTVKVFVITLHSGLNEIVEAERYRQHKDRLIFQAKGSAVRIYHKKLVLMVEEKQEFSVGFGTQ
jgi:hypothetical protein